ncbi:MAG: hypothetical protein ACTHMF_11805 [Leifsonia sp.]|uniref:hypothetical protein n=1 Tax=Leifsonia sp. TaxID=1870902 RepID=UPI003F7F6739
MTMHASVQHEPHPDENAPVPYLRHGQLISLIHWQRVAGDWKYTTMLVEYAGRDDQHWQVVAKGQPMVLDRADWAIFN